MEDWANTWKMVFNIDKCEVLQISLGNSAPVNYCLYDNPLRIDSMKPNTFSWCIIGFQA